MSAFFGQPTIEGNAIQERARYTSHLIANMNHCSPTIFPEDVRLYEAAGY